VWGREGDGGGSGFRFDLDGMQASAQPGKKTKWTELERQLSWDMSTIVCVVFGLSGGKKSCTDASIVCGQIGETKSTTLRSSSTTKDQTFSHIIEEDVKSNIHIQGETATQNFR
jgi:hypothetical protein